MTAIFTKKAGRKDIKQGQKQDMKPRAYWKAVHTGHHAHVYREENSQTAHTQTHSRVRIGMFSRPVRPAYHINIGFHVLLLPLLYVLTSCFLA
jgi:hypothetical protein